MAPPEEPRVPAGEGPRRRARAHVAPHGVPVADVLEVGVRHEHAAHAVASDLGDDQAGRDGRVACAVAVAEARRVAAEEVRRVVHVFVRERRRHEVRVLPVLLRAEEPPVHEEAALVDEHAERRREEHAREVARHGLRALGHRRVLRQRRLEGGLHARVEVEVRGAPQEREQQHCLHDHHARAVDHAIIVGCNKAPPPSITCATPALEPRIRKRPPEEVHEADRRTSTGPPSRALAGRQICVFSVGGWLLSRPRPLKALRDPREFAAGRAPDAVPRKETTEPFNNGRPLPRGPGGL